MGKSYTMPFYSGVKEGGVVIINSAQPLLSEEDITRLKDLNVSLFYIAGTELAIEVAGTELSTNMSMIGSVAGITNASRWKLWMVLYRNGLGRNLSHLAERPPWTKPSRRSSPKGNAAGQEFGDSQASIRDRKRMGRKK
ncbi:MAG: 2-oxoacid:acceptor oxidoreductase family protein [Nitrospira sp.]